MVLRAGEDLLVALAHGQAAGWSIGTWSRPTC